MAQLTLYGTETVDMPQVLLPLATDAQGQTLYDHSLGEGRTIRGAWGRRPREGQLEESWTLLDRPDRRRGAVHRL